MIIAPKVSQAAISENVWRARHDPPRHVHVRRAAPEGRAGTRGHGIVRGCRVAECRARRAHARDKATGEELIVDGVRLIFQITPGTEAPAEMNIYIPKSARCDGRELHRDQHNVYTLRGAQVRDALMWSKYIDQSLELYATSATCSSRVITARWGREDLSEYLASQRDAYRYVQTRPCVWRITV